MNNEQRGPTNQFENMWDDIDCEDFGIYDDLQLFSWKVESEIGETKQGT